MIGVVMAGGKGSRMHLDKEKMLLEHKKPIILNVVDALKASKCFSRIVAITSNNSPETRKLLLKHKIEMFDSSGNGYVQDLNLFLQSVSDSVFVTSGDLPLLDGEIIKNIVKQYDSENTWTSILVTKNFLESLKISSEYEVVFDNQQCCYTGISLVNAQGIFDLAKTHENYVIFDDRRVGFNLNTKEDYDLLGST